MNNKLQMIENRLDELTASCGALHPTVCDAMRYSLLDAGKRVRPVFTLSFCEALGGDAESALDFACAVEMVHTYSLIHDDLPCMDDDDMRRGKPSCHKVYGEAVALLAGDALLTLAFGTIAQCKTVSADKIAAAAAELARLSGAAGMVGGQVIDLDSEGKSVPIETLRVLDAGKTCALIEAACVLGCICADADEAALSAARKYASGVGMAFQIVDDILDVTGDEAILGKPVESDAGNNKSTYVSLMGIEGASAEARRYTQEATAALDVLGGECEFLKDFAQKLLYRIS
ncbi:MAG: polyprenyl synthetase family protein [Ruminococcaceae bacterium]|nr:polyprenyl synthetase family protein [Oscillospiraceae bacterium]